MDNKEALNTLSEIKDMMERSSRFQTISGWSIILIGLYASIVSLGAWLTMGGGASLGWLPDIWQQRAASLSRNPTALILIAALLVVVSMGTVCLMSYVKTKRVNKHFSFDKTVRRPLVNFLVPAVAGALFCVAMLFQQHYGLTSSIMLIFYGLALINCHHYTTSSIGALGYGELILGIIDCFVVHQGLLFWFLGFGALHIVYGIAFLMLKVES